MAVLVGKERKNLNQLELIVKVMLEPELDRLIRRMIVEDGVTRRELRRDLNRVEPETLRKKG